MSKNDSVLSSDDTMGSGERPITRVLNHEVPIQQCGWLKDKFGVSWQVWPDVVPELLTSSDP